MGYITKKTGETKQELSTTEKTKQEPSTTEQELSTTKKTGKDNILTIVLVITIIIITIQITIKISTFVILIIYYDTLNDNIEIDETIKNDDYKYIYKLAISNIVFTLFTIFCFFLACLLYIINFNLFETHKILIEWIISILWIISSIISIASYIIRLQIKDKYKKYLGDIYDDHLSILSYIGIFFFVSKFIISNIYNINLY